MAATLQYQPGTQASGALAGTERVSLDNGGAVSVTCTTQQIANLASVSSNNASISTISTTGATGTLTAPAIISRIISRSGPTQNFTDTTATAAAIIALLPASEQVAGTSFRVTYLNTTNYIATVAGTGSLTAAGVLICPPNSALDLFFALTSATAITMTGLLVENNTSTSTTMTGATSGYSTIQPAAIAGTAVLTLPGTTDTLAGIAATQTLTNKTITDAIQNGNTVCTATITANTTTVVANITGLSVALTSTGTYTIDAHLVCAGAANAGIKVAFSGTATATSLNASAWAWNGTTLNTVTNITSLASNLAATTTANTDVIIKGSIVVNAAGTLTLAGAQNVLQASNTTFVTGSTMNVQRVS